MLGVLIEACGGHVDLRFEMAGVVGMKCLPITTSVFIISILRPIQLKNVHRVIPDAPPPKRSTVSVSPWWCGRR